MSFSTLGDMAQAFSLRYRNTVLKTEIQTLNKELATGQADDLAAHLGGSYAQLTSLERDMRVLEGYNINIVEAKQLTDAMQVRLDQLFQLSSDFSGNLISSVSSGNAATQSALAVEAEVHFATIVSVLNSQTAGRSMFAGEATDRPALIDSADILSEISNVISGSSSLADVQTNLDTWFSDPAGFDSFAYTGGTNDIAPFQLSETSQMSLSVRADAQEFKDVLKALATVIASEDPGLSIDAETKDELRQAAGLGLLQAQENLVGLQAEIGLAQESIAQWNVRTQSEMLSLEYAKGALLAIDPYEKASELEAAQFQLEALYAVTARLSQLSLVNFLR